MESIIILLFYIVYYVVIFGISIANYIMQSLGLQRIAQKAGVSKPWLSWLPLGREWILGSVTDAFDCAKGKNKKWRKWLVILSLLTYVGLFALYAILIVMAILLIVFESVMAGEAAGVITILYCLILCIACLVLCAAAIAQSVLCYICLYKIFDETVPEKCLLYFLLSFFVPLAFGICLLSAGKKYMPDTKQEVDGGPVLEGQ